MTQRRLEAFQARIDHGFTVAALEPGKARTPIFEDGDVHIGVGIRALATVAAPRVLARFKPDALVYIDVAIRAHVPTAAVACIGWRVSAETVATAFVQAWQALAVVCLVFAQSSAISFPVVQSRTHPGSQLISQRVHES